MQIIRTPQEKMRLALDQAALAVNTGQAVALGIILADAGGAPRIIIDGETDRAWPTLLAGLTLMQHALVGFAAQITRRAQQAAQGERQ